MAIFITQCWVERIMKDALEDYESTVSIGRRTITNLRFADDIDDLAVEDKDLEKLAEHLDKAPTAYGMEIAAEKCQHQWHQQRDQS